jgi:hypothetical protein
MADGLDLVVHSLHGAVGDPVLGPAQNPIEMPTQHTHEFLEGLQPGAHGRTHPFLQVVAGPLGLPVIPEQLKGLPSQSGPTAFDSAVVTRAQGSAQGKFSARKPQWGIRLAAGGSAGFNGNFRIDRSRHSRGWRTRCTFRHRCRQTPQRSNRRPSRSMWTITQRPVYSTFVTVCAFSPSCFLRNVSTSTPNLFLSMAVNISPQKIRCIDVLAWRHRSKALDGSYARCDA